MAVRFDASGARSSALTVFGGVGLGLGRHCLPVWIHQETRTQVRCREKETVEEEMVEDGEKRRRPGASPAWSPPTHAALKPRLPSIAPPGAHPTCAALTPPSHRYGPYPLQPDLGLLSSGRGRPDLGLLSSGARETTKSNAKMWRLKWHQGGAAMALRQHGARRRPSPPPPGRLEWYSPRVSHHGILARSVRDPRAGSSSIETSMTWPNPFIGESNPTRSSCIRSP
jgi:hypothetical protein